MLRMTFLQGELFLKRRREYRARLYAYKALEMLQCVTSIPTRNAD